MSIFTQVAMQKPKHNTFDLSHERKFSMKAGVLTPCFIAEVVPNDMFTIQTNQLVRMAPMQTPVMHRFSVYTHFFYVPNRILWENWTEFINGGESGEEDPVFPFLNLDDMAPYLTVGSLADYLGLPVEQANLDTENVSAMPFAVFKKIWYEYYRDQNLMNNPIFDYLKDTPLVDGDNVTNVATLCGEQFRAWQHDYFTSALPWTQRGPQATIPLGTTADVGFKAGIVPESTFILTSGTLSSANNITGTFPSTATGALKAAGIGGAVNNADALEVLLSEASAATINDLRRAFRLQEWLELNARAGARYNEMIIAHFGISPGDARLNRPEFLGGSSTPMVISEVLQTAPQADESSVLADMAGHGVSIGGKRIVNYRCREHGFIMGICTIMPKSAYQQGIHKSWFKFDKFDYFWKSFANIGEQAILNKEIYFDASDGQNDAVFGYTPRYAEYKYLNDSVHGEFRESLDFWHAGRIFQARPTLSAGFVTMDSDEISRIFTVTNAEQFYVQMYHSVKARRPMPYFGTPTL